MNIKSVLVVDDSATERFFITDILRRNGYDVLAATNAEEGITLAKTQKPDLILMDVVMPGLNGFQATRMLNRDADTKDIPVIICTSKDHETDRIWGMRQGAVEYLVKPIEAEELISKILSLS